MKLVFCVAHHSSFSQIGASGKPGTLHRRKDTVVEAVLEQLIEHGPGEMASVFARAFELAMQIERDTERSCIVVNDLHQFLEARLRQVSAKSRLGEAIRYALTRWDGLVRFLDDGRLDLDNNAANRALRPFALNRKNALFAGSDGGGDNWAVIATLIENCKLAGINPHSWLTATLTSLANGHSASRIGELMPWTDVP